MVYFAWILRGVTPPKDFLYPFLFQYRKPVAITETIPESPLYCPRLGFFTIIRNKRCTPQIYALLCDMRDLTCGFVDLELLGPRERIEMSTSTPDSIFTRVLGLPSANISGIAVSGDWVYECCRLAAYIYCYQLCTPVVNRSVNLLSLVSVTHNLQSALAKTDTSGCWGDMAGVLFWCALVGSNCMHDALSKSDAFFQSDESLVNDLNLQKNEYCRKWLTLLAVRLGVVLGFQYPEAICVTLRRFIHVRGATFGHSTSLG
jgi:hypothetical protein